MDADRERLAVGAWSGEADRTLRHEAEAAGTVRPGEEFFTGPGTRQTLTTNLLPVSARELLRSYAWWCAPIGCAPPNAVWG